MHRPFHNHPFPSAVAEVDLDEPHRLAAWCRYFGVFSGTLREAVAAVGPVPSALLAYLGTPRDLRRHAGGRCLR